MAVVHFLNVSNGDCSVIQHNSGRVTVIDVCNASSVGEPIQLSEAVRYMKSAGVLGNFNRKDYPDNPIAYLKDRGITSVFRFVVTHPDMDHIDGIRDFFCEFTPSNFWDTDNNKEMEEFGYGGYSEDDWNFYAALRDQKPTENPKRLALYSGSTGPFYNEDGTGKSGGDGLYILAPTPELMMAANDSGDFNDSSYVILYRTGNKRILFSGDSHNGTWEHVLDKHHNDVAGVDVLIAPHHGRDSGRDYDFLDVVNPKLTLFGNANCEHLAYTAWNNRNLMFITNNQAGTIIMNVDSTGLNVYTSHKPFAEAFTEQRGYSTHYDQAVRGYYLGTLK
jgi:competence protein ComEC